jgi:hypothetical protein
MHMDNKPTFSDIRDATRGLPFAIGELLIASVITERMPAHVAWRLGCTLADKARRQNVNVAGDGI